MEYRNKTTSQTYEKKTMEFVNSVWDDTNEIGAYKADNSNEFTISHLPCCILITHSDVLSCLNVAKRTFQRSQNRGLPVRSVRVILERKNRSATH